MVFAALICTPRSRLPLHVQQEKIAAGGFEDAAAGPGVVFRDRIFLAVHPVFSVPYENPIPNNSREQVGVQCLCCREGGEKRRPMLWTIFVVLLLLWLVGLLSSYTFGGLIYLLLVAALIVLIIQLVSGRRHVV